MAVSVGVQLERNNALEDARAMIELRGMDISLFTVDGESNVERGRYGGIKERTPVKKIIKASPVLFNPTDNQLKKMGIREKVDVALTLSTKALTLLGIAYKAIDLLRWEVGMEESKYTIKDKNRINHFADTFLNVTLGLMEK